MCFIARRFERDTYCNNEIAFIIRKIIFNAKVKVVIDHMYKWKRILGSHGPNIGKYI